MHFDPFRLQLQGQRRLRAVVTGHRLAPGAEIPGQVAHANAADSDEINMGVMIGHCFYTLISLKISSAMRSAELCWASFRMLALSLASFARLGFNDSARGISVKRA